MAKKDKKKKDSTADSSAADAVEAVRAAVERTFRATTESAAGTQRRLVDEVAHAAARIREDLRVLEDVRGLRTEVEALSQRVAALEAAKKTAAKPRATRSRSTASKPSGTRSSAQRPPAS